MNIKCIMMYAIITTAAIAGSTARGWISRSLLGLLMENRERPQRRQPSHHDDRVAHVVHPEPPRRRRHMA